MLQGPTPGDSHAMGALCIVSLCLSQSLLSFWIIPLRCLFLRTPCVFDFEKRMFRLPSSPYRHLAFPAKLPSAAGLVA